MRWGRRWLSIVMCACLLVGAACMQEAPVTGRSQLVLVSNQMLFGMAKQQYGDFLQKNQTSSNTAQAAVVKRVGRRIRDAVEAYFRKRGEPDRLKNYDWRFELIESDQANAFAMPGGRVVIYTGILPLCKNENGLAAVMGHEIAHAVANHGAERMSHQLLVQLGGLALQQAIKKKPEKTRALFMTAYGAGATVGFVLPYSRVQEYEADQLGLIFMAMAGYDPRDAVPLWERMKAKGGGSPPEFLSTHPAPQNRIDRMQAMMPEALTYRTPPVASSTLPGIQ